MEPITITVDGFLNYLANRYLDSRQPPVSQERKNAIMPATKYNLLVSTFNLSTVLLVMAAAAVVFLNIHMAVLLGGVAIFARMTVEKQLHAIGQPDNPEHFFRHAMNFVAGLPNRNTAQTILEKVGLRDVPGWNPDRLIVFDYSLWKAQVSLPE